MTPNIADLENTDIIKAHHVAGAIQYRQQSRQVPLMTLRNFVPLL